VVVTEGEHLPLAGLLLILPALAATGLTEAFAATYGRLRNAFYGLRSTVLMLLFLALLRDPRAEGATRIRPADLGRLLGLDRAPEVKTLRRKLTELAGCHRGAQVQAALALDLGWKGKPDHFLLADAGARGYDVLVTNDSGQLDSPKECRGIRDSGIHHTRYRMLDGLDGLALAMGADWPLSGRSSRSWRAWAHSGS
jgi:hypothetical protein